MSKKISKEFKLGSFDSTLQKPLKMKQINRANVSVLEEPNTDNSIIIKESSQRIKPNINKKFIVPNLENSFI